MPRGRAKKVEVIEGKKSVTDKNKEDRREKELFLEIKERMVARGYYIVDHMPGAMVVAHTVKVKVPFIPQANSFMEPTYNEKNICTMTLIVWHKDQFYLSEVFPKGSFYDWLWSNGNGENVKKIRSREDVMRLWGNL